MFIRTDDDNGLTHPLHLNRRRNPSRRPTINHNIYPTSLRLLRRDRTTRNDSQNPESTNNNP
jgi:hypothetical protein